jgi:prepilin-type N-terminal cleavage/methylation domain-containing protein
MRARVRKGFTLVEILIVVVILGILAAIVVPQFTNATQDAQGGNILTQLETLNNQIELYRARTAATNADLEAMFGGATPWQGLIAGGYLKSEPRHPRMPQALAAAPTTPAGTSGSTPTVTSTSAPRTSTRTPVNSTSPLRNC